MVGNPWEGLASSSSAGVDVILSFRSESELLWYFNVADVGGRSAGAFGHVLERQETRYTDSAGRVLPIAGKHFNYISVKDDPKTSSNEGPSYTPDHSTMVRAAVISRKLGALSAQQQQALTLYHGALGAEWESLFGRIHRVACLIPITDGGRRWLTSMYSRHTSISGDHIVRAEMSAQKAEPNDIRCKQLEKLEQEAYALRITAETAYQGIVV